MQYGLRLLRRTWRGARAGALLALLLGAALAAPGHAQISIERLAAVDDKGALVTADRAAVGLNGKLALVLKVDAGVVVDPGKAVLYLEGRAIPGLNDTIYRANDRALIFHLQRTADNATAWQPLLASPGLTPRAVAVGLLLQAPAPGAPFALLAQEDHQQPTFDLVLISWPWLVAAGLAALAVVGVVLYYARGSNLLRDPLLPQLAPIEQPFSLGRTQMAWWFVLVFCAYAFLFVLLWDYNTLTSPALALMGLSGGTAVFAASIDAGKDTPIDTANDALRAIGLRTYADLQQIEAELEQHRAALRQLPAGADQEQQRLQAEIDARLQKQRTHQEITRPFVSQGWWRDLSTDINGPALHRVQLIFWMVIFGGMFVVELYRNLSMPQFSQLQLSLMGITSAGYLGFKFPEQQH